MLPALTLLLACQLAGEVLVRSLDLTIPGPVLGLVLLAAGLLVWSRRQPDLTGTALEKLSTAILGTLGLLFVPAGVGVIGQLDLLAGHILPIVLVLVVSTALTLLVTVGTFLLVKRFSP